MRPYLLLCLGQLLVFGFSGVQTLSKTIPVVDLNPNFDHRWWTCKENKIGLKIFHFWWKDLGKQRWGEGLPFQAHIVELSVKGILKVSFLKNQFFLWRWPSAWDGRPWCSKTLNITPGPSSSTLAITFPIGAMECTKVSFPYSVHPLIILSNKVLMKRSFLHWVRHGPMALVGNRKLNKWN